MFWKINFSFYACVILGSIINYSCHWQKIGVWIPTKEKKSGCESWLATMYSDPHVSLSKEIRVILNECISLIISIRLPWACGISWKSVFTSQLYVKKNVRKVICEDCVWCKHWGGIHSENIGGTNELMNKLITTQYSLPKPHYRLDFNVPFVETVGRIHNPLTTKFEKK